MAVVASTAVPVTATVKVTCQDSSSDAARLQQAINSSPAGSAIEFEGGTCLLTKGLTLPLLSYGRSSLLVSLAWLGVLLRIYHEVKCNSRSAVMRQPKEAR